MQVKCLEVRDRATFLPVICIKPMPDNEGQRYLLRRDGYSCEPTDPIVIMIDAQCRHVAYDAYHWRSDTHKQAHIYIMEHWAELKDGDVVDVEFIIGLTSKPKVSEREGWPV
jgi:hypothetical protein